MPTIRQIAELAGVSHSTVSRALRNNPRISLKMRQYIQGLAEEYHYRPNRLAQGILTGKSATLGCVLNDVSLPFESRILRGVLEAAYGESYRVIVLESRMQLPHTRQTIHALIEQRVEGILIASIHQEPVPVNSIMELRSHGVVPVALDFANVDAPIDRVCTDEAALGEAAVEYLWSLGHREIAFVGPAANSARGARARAISHALRRRGCSTTYIMDWGSHFYQETDAEHLLDQLFSRTPHPTAIIGFEDRFAAKCVQVAQRRGIRIPHDLSVMGCANLSVTEFVTPAITTIEQNPEEIGRRACRLLMQRILESTTQPDPLPQTLLTPVAVIKRDSCARPPR